LDGFDTLDRFKCHAGLEFGVVSSAFAFHVVCVWYGLKSAPTHHNHSLTTGPIFGVQLTPQSSLNRWPYFWGPTHSTAGPNALLVNLDTQLYDRAMEIFPK
jgi:hypothetical protein